MSDCCRTCKAPVVWAVTEKGRPMPVDPDRVPNGNIELEDGEDGTVARYVKADPSVERHVSHFATCQFAAEHRKAPK